MKRRTRQTAVVFNRKMYIFGGEFGSGDCYNDFYEFSFGKFQIEVQVPITHLTEISLSISQRIIPGLKFKPVEPFLNQDQDIQQYCIMVLCTFSEVETRILDIFLIFVNTTLVSQRK